MQRGEIHLHSESTPGYFSVVEPSLVKDGTVIPLYYDAYYDGTNFSVPDVMEGIVDPAVPGVLPQAQGPRSVGAVVGRVPHQSCGRFRDAAHHRDAARRASGRAGGATHCAGAAQQRQGLCRRYDESDAIRAAL